MCHECWLEAHSMEMRHKKELKEHKAKRDILSRRAVIRLQEKYQVEKQFFKSHIAILESEVKLWRNIFIGVKKAMKRPWYEPWTNGLADLSVGEETITHFSDSYDDMNKPIIQGKE